MKFQISIVGSLLPYEGLGGNTKDFYEEGPFHIIDFIYKFRLNLVTLYGQMTSIKN